MRNIALTLAYDGTNYVGWQIQPNGLSIQAVVERAIEQLTGEAVTVLAAGRTDSGVHALGQAASFQTDRSIPCKQIQNGLNNFLPDDVVVWNVQEVPESFHATYSAIKKRYRYVMHNSRVRNPFVSPHSWRVAADLDVPAMHDAAQSLLGTHDFRCFESHFPNKATSVRTILEATVRRHPGWTVWSEFQTTDPGTDEDRNGEFIWFEIVADGFLYNMVRAIMGTLVKVGLGKWPKSDVARIIENQDRSQAGETAPPQGLYLVKVCYDDLVVRGQDSGFGIQQNSEPG